MDDAPLAEKLRPKKLKEFVGQKHLVGKEGLIAKLLENSPRPSGASSEGGFPSIIFWGPPGSGKTTLARIIAKELKRGYFEFSAVNTSSKDIEKVISKSTKTGSPGADSQLGLLSDKTKSGQKNKTDKKSAPIVFLDEIHRFNKAQQDKLLPHVEKGTIILIGATTENPSFEVIGPLLSRTRVITLEQLGEKELKKILKKGEKHLDKKLNKKAKDFIIESSNGDARILLTALEIASNLTDNKTIKLSGVEKALQQKQLAFDKKGEEYYNVISAFIKSMRASQPDAALYYLARMVEAGQDPLYIARRIVIFASEDVGMADPQALVIANEAFRACETTGYPECAINLAHATVYMAKAKKDRSAYEAYFKAVEDVKRHGNLPVPKKIRNAPTELMKDLGYGKGYKKYDKESLLPEKIKDKKYYEK